MQFLSLLLQKDTYMLYRINKEGVEKLRIIITRFYVITTKLLSISSLYRINGILNQVQDDEKNVWRSVFTTS